MSWACVAPEGLVEKKAAVSIGLVEFINCSGHGLIDFLVLVSPESSPNCAGQIWANRDKKIRARGITGVGRSEGVLEVDSKWFHYKR